VIIDEIEKMEFICLNLLLQLMERYDDKSYPTALVN